MVSITMENAGWPRMGRMTARSSAMPNSAMPAMALRMASQNGKPISVMHARPPKAPSIRAVGPAQHVFEFGAQRGQVRGRDRGHGVPGADAIVVFAVVKIEVLQGHGQCGTGQERCIVRQSAPPCPPSHARSKNMNEETTVLQVQGLGFSHPQQPVFAGWSARVGPGTTLVQGGESSGKTTLLRLLAGALAPPP